MYKSILPISSQKDPKNNMGVEVHHGAKKIVVFPKNDVNNLEPKKSALPTKSDEPAQSILKKGNPKNLYKNPEFDKKRKSPDNLNEHEESDSKTYSEMKKIEIFSKR